MEDRVDALAAVGLADRGAEVLGAGVDGGVGAEPRDQGALLLAGGEADHLRAGPLGDLHGERAGAAGGGLDDDRLARLDPGAALDQRHRGQALQQHRRGLVVVDLVGDRDQQRLGDDDLLGVAAAAEQRRDAAPVGGAAADLGAGDQRQRLLGEVVVAGRVGVGEVDAAAGHLDQDLALAGGRIVELDVLEHVGTAELLYLDRLHRPRSLAGQALGCRPHVAHRRRIDRL